MNPTEWMKKQDQLRNAWERISGIQGQSQLRVLSHQREGLVRPKNLYFVSGRLANITPKIRFLNVRSSFVSGRLVAMTWYQRCFVERRQVACLFHMRRLDRGSRVICFYPKELENNYYRLLAYYILTIFWELLITNYQNMVIQRGAHGRRRWWRRLNNIIGG